MMDQSFNLAPGRTLGSNYEVVELLGSGWEGEVYKVIEQHTGIIRAAKLFYLRDTPREAPLRRYARKLHKLRSCPIIIQYHHRDRTRIRGREVEFLVSDLADGEMLSSFLERRRGKKLPVFEALHLIYALAKGVEQIHFLAEYHGDIHSDNVMVKKRGLGFEVHLLDFLDLGRASREKIQNDVYLIISLLYEILGGPREYQRLGKEVKGVILGNKRNLIGRHFKTAGHLRLALENLTWEI